MKAVRFAVDHPVTISMATLAAGIFGMVALSRLDVQLLPDIRYPSLTIQTEFPNTAPVDVENLVTRPLEEAVGVVPGLRKVHSISQAGLSQVTLEFDWQTKMDYAALEVREKIDLVTLPEDADPPALLKYDPALDPVLRIGIWGNTPLVQLRNTADEVVKKELETIQGVAAAKVSGGLEEEIQVEIDEAKLATLGLSLNDVATALREENVNASGGRLRDRNAEYLVRTLSRFTTLEDIETVMVGERDGQPIRLSDVAEIHRGHRERTTITHVDGRESVEIAVYKEGDENIVEVAGRVHDELERLGKDLPETMKMEVLFDQSVFIRDAVREVRDNAIQGGILSILILYVALRDLRSTLIIGLSIPISILATFVLMYTRNVSLNIMSLGGLAIGVGMIVDNSIVVLESVFRNRTKTSGIQETKEDVVQGTGEVGGAVIGSTFTTIAVFLPVVFVVEGISGQIFGDQALTVTLSILVSLIVALTFTPMLAALGLPKTSREVAARDAAGPPAAPGSWKTFVRPGRLPKFLRSIPPFLFLGAPVFMLRGARAAIRFLSRAIEWILTPASWLFEKTYPRSEAIYDRLLRASLRHRGWVLASVALLVILTAGLLGTLGADLVPPLAQGEFTLDLEMPEGTPLGRTETFVADLGRKIREVKGVSLVSAGVGMSREGDSNVSRRKENRAEVHVRLEKASKEEEARVVEAARQILAGNEDVSMKIRRPSLFTFNTPVEVDVYGHDLDEMMGTAARVQKLIGEVDGVRDVRVAMVPGSPEIRVTFDREKLNRLGLRLSEVAGTVQSKVRGTVATRFRDEERHIDIRVQNSEEERSTLTAVRDLIVAERDGVPIRLASIASFETVVGPAEIHRLGNRRSAIVTANLSGRDLASATVEIRKSSPGCRCPRTSLGSWAGRTKIPAFPALAAGRDRAGHLSRLPGHGRAVRIVSLSVHHHVHRPASRDGRGSRALDHPYPAFRRRAIGGIMLAGIVVNNGIILVDRINQLRRKCRCTMRSSRPARNVTGRSS